MHLSCCPRIIWCLSLIPNIYLILREREIERVYRLLTLFFWGFSPYFMISRIWQIFQQREEKLVHWREFFGMKFSGKKQLNKNLRSPPPPPFFLSSKRKKRERKVYTKIKSRNFYFPLPTKSQSIITLLLLLKYLVDLKI